MNFEQMKNSAIQEEKMKWQRRSAYSALNTYAKENATFGRIKNGDKIPFDVYLHEIGMQDVAPLIDCEHADGSILNKGVVCYSDIENLYKDIFFDKLGIVLYYAYVSGGEGYNVLSNSLFAIFKEIMQTKIHGDTLNAVPDFADREELLNYYNKSIRFINAIEVRKLKQDRCVDRYLKDIQYISPFILRLVEKKKGRYFLKNNDTLSFDYKLAVLSCLPFYNPYNVKLFELKMQSMERLKSQN